MSKTSLSWVPTRVTGLRPLALFELRDKGVGGASVLYRGAADPLEPSGVEVSIVERPAVIPVVVGPGRPYPTREGPV